VRIVTIVGARPQFIKAAPLCRALAAAHEEILVHTGQHYDDNMSAVFFRELGVRAPDHFLGIGSGPHGAQTGAMLAAIERVLLDARPDTVVVFGDTNSTLAGALAAVKLHIPVAHVEAGLRSFRKTMPEEINRVLVDHIASLLFVPSPSAADQLAQEGVVDGVHIVGDIMRDALEMFRGRARTDTLTRLDVTPRGYVAATVHRAENTDDETRLRSIIDGLSRLELPVVLPLHPRTRKRLDELAIAIPRTIRIVEPLGYLESIALLAGAACVATDSGGIQKEAYFLGVPCVTLRDETEWAETIGTGWNVLAGADADRIAAHVKAQMTPRGPRPPLYGDAGAAMRIVATLESSNLRSEGLAAVVAEWEAEHGVITEEKLREVDRQQKRKRRS
jgi:UDP-N-acetylglucosamine 2-epimerase